MMKKYSILLYIVSTLLYGAPNPSVSATRIPADQELIEYTSQVHRQEYAKLDKEAQNKIKEEYKKRIDFADAAIKDGLNNPEFSWQFRRARENLGIELWTKSILAKVNPTEEELKALFAQTKDLKVSARYKLNHIVVSDEKIADELLKKIEQREKAKQKEQFQAFVATYSENVTTKAKAGEVGWVDVTTVGKNVMDLIKDKKEGSFVKLTVSPKHFEILHVENVIPEHKATFEEAKGHLINLAKQRVLEKEKERILPSSVSKQPAKK